MNWDDVGDAIQQAVSLSSGVTTVWKYQNMNAPALPYVAISIGSMLALGIDYTRASFDITRPNGQEFKFEVKGIREIALEIEAFTASSVAGRQAAALALCSQTCQGLLLTNPNSILAAQAVAPFDFGPVQWVPDVVGVGFRGRAHATVRCYARPPTVVEYAGYIARVTGQVNVFGMTSSPSGYSTFGFDTAAAGPPRK